jgi:probable H4MPT-linked C1 transfer pathway protein
MTTHQTEITGWDIGGAHLKVTRCNQQGHLTQAIEIPCPLWQGIEYLEQAIKTAQQQIGPLQALAAITMTGELVDIFTDRQSGVRNILDCLMQFIPEQCCQVYAGEAGWLTPTQAKIQWQQVASRNWQASAVFTAQQIQQGLFIDVGSTTSDIIPIQNNKATPNAFTDFERQANSELHYAGAIRTPLIAIAHQAPFKGQYIRLAAEVFATTGDCWCLLNALDSAAICDSSADGQPWQQQDCARRLARLLGTDAATHPAEQWHNLAQWFADQQIDQLYTACETVLSAHPAITHDAPIIGAGVGRFIIQHCAKKLDRRYIDFSQLVEPPSSQAADHAPAAAVALLAWHQLT